MIQVYRKHAQPREALSWTNRTLPLTTGDQYYPNTSASFQSGIYSTDWRPRTTPRRRARALAPTISTIEKENSQVLPSSLAQASAPNFPARVYSVLYGPGAFIVAAHPLPKLFCITPRCRVYLFFARHKQRDLNLTPSRDRIHVAFSKQTFAFVIVFSLRSFYNRAIQM